MLLLALATLTIFGSIEVSVEFTADSVYKDESIISIKEVIPQDNDLYTVVFEPDKLLGYKIYDDNDTIFLDGFKFDGKYVTNYVVRDVDFNVTQHTALIKTVYSDDVAGMLVSAKDGDWSKIIANPLIVFQLIYYCLAGISIILGGFGLYKSKKQKVKTSEEIAAIVEKKASESSANLSNEAKEFISAIVGPLCEKLHGQNQKIIEALILSQSGDKDSKLALINLLKESATEDITALTDTMYKAIEAASSAKEKAKKEAADAVKSISEGVFEDKNDIGGISI